MKKFTESTEKEFQKILRLRFDERNRQLIGSFTQAKQRMNSRGLLNSSETIKGYRVSSNNEACYAATHSARQPEIALNSLVGVGAMTKTKKSIGGVVVSVLAYCIGMMSLKPAQSVL
jgi:hypothetical protein